MRNLKKFLALVLATLMMVSAAAVVSADFTDVPADNRYAAAINDLAVKGIVRGTDTTETTFNPTADVTRTQMAIMLARTLSGDTENDARWTKGIVPYTDVTEYAGAIEYVQVKGLINGWTDINGKLVFGPKDNVTYVQALKMAIGALGYTEELTWPWGYYNKAVELGLTANMDVTELDAELNRAETAQIIYNVLYAEPAEGGLTIAEANFGIATANNTSLFVITATPNQYYAKDADGDNYNANASDVDGDYVGIQALVNGVPDGNMIYVPVEALGIAVADVENYFNYAVELVNYDAKTGDFDDAILGEAPAVVDHTKVTVTGGDKKIKIDIDNKATTYTTVNSITGATLNNEIVVYNGSISEDVAQMLVMDEDGYVYKEGYLPVGKLLYTSANGTRYFHKYGNETEVISESEALTLWGVNVLDEAGAYVQYATLQAAAMKNKAYQLSLFDDDRDGLYERAVYTPIYMGVYYTYKAKVGTADTVCDGLIKGIVGDTKAADVKYSNADAKVTGAISVFTYNEQLNTVNVIDILEVQTGTIDKINGTGFKDTDNNKNTVKFTVDGTVYTLAYNSFPGGKSITDAQLGAQVLEVERYSDYTVEDLGDEAFLEIESDKSTFVNYIDTDWVDTTIAFVAYNDYILMFDEASFNNVYNFALVDDWSDFDLGEIYMDLWIAGEIEEEATVTVLNGKELADLSTAKFSLLLSRDELFWPGNIYTMDVEEGNYLLNDRVELDKLANGRDDDGRLGYDDEFELYNVKYANDSYAADSANVTTGMVEFVNGNTTTNDRDQQLRTTSDTIFYFITNIFEKDANGVEQRNEAYKLDEYEREVKVWTGDIADDLYIEFDEFTEIWTDSIGVGEDRASVVFVFNPKATNFFASEITFVLGSFSNRYAFDVDDAEDFGLSENYEGKTIYAYPGTYIDALTGEKIASTIYSLAKIPNNAGNAVSFINEDNMLCDRNGNLVKNFDDATAIIKREEINTSVDTLFGANAETYMVYAEAERDYAKYGITNLSGDTTSSADGKWGVPNYAEIEESAAMLVDDGRKLYHYDESTGDYIETGWDGTNWTDSKVATHVDVINYYDWYYAKETKFDNGELPNVPKYIYEVPLVEDTEIIDMDSRNDEIVYLNVKVDGNFIPVIDRDNADDVEVVVYTWGNANGVTGADAYKILKTAPMVWFMVDEAEDGSISFDSAMADGVLEFYVLYENVK